MNPLIRASLAHIEQEGDDFLQGIDFEIEKNKQQFVFDRAEPGFASATAAALPYSLVAVMLVDVGVPRLGKGDEYMFEFGLV